MCGASRLTGLRLAAVCQVLAGGGVGEEVEGVGRPIAEHERQRASVQTRHAVLLDDAQQAVSRATVLGLGGVGFGSSGLRLALQAHLHHVARRHHRRLRDGGGREFRSSWMVSRWFLSRGRSSNQYLSHTGDQARQEDLRLGVGAVSSSCLAHALQAVPVDAER